MRDKKNKWFVPPSVYPHFKFPPYVDGPAYVISADIVAHLAKRADKFPFLFLEDVFVTGTKRCDWHWPEVIKNGTGNGQM